MQIAATKVKPDTEVYSSKRSVKYLINDWFCFRKWLSNLWIYLQQ
jgi:hypothetical protein